ncbi:MAG: NCS2 family permease [Alphaproteobacteria bacterium]
MFARFFEFDRHGTTMTTEVRAGITTFLTMAYIIVVNPNILEAAGIPKGPSTIATILAAVVGTFLMAVYAKRPIAVAPYMGENAFIAFSVCGLLGASWQTALGAVFIGGVVFVIITAVHLRGWLANAVPTNLKYSFVVGIGLFLAFIGLMNTGIITKGAGEDVPVMLGKIDTLPVLLAIVTLVLMIALMIKKVRGAIFFSIVGMTILGVVLKAAGVEVAGVHLPQKIVSLPTGLGEIAFQLDIIGALKLGFIPVLLTVFLMDFVDTMGTLIGVSDRAGFLDEDGNLPEIEKPMMADAVGTVVGALAGTSTTGAYIESATGVEEGGRTGMTALVVAGLFALALFFTPILTIVPGFAAGPALIVVGILMLGSVKKIDFEDMTELFPAFMTIVLMIFTFNLGIGITAGFVFYPLTKLIAGRLHEVNVGTWALFGISAIFYLVYGVTFH